MTVDTLPITLAQAKAHLRVLHSDDDAAIQNLIAAAVDDLEQRTGRAFSAITARLSLSAFPDGPIAIPRPPLAAVSSITYTTAAGGVTLPAESYNVDASHAPALITPLNEWPVAVDRPGSVVVNFAAGDPANCPPRVANAILLWIDHEYSEHGWLESRRISERIQGAISGLTLHSPELSGVSFS